MGRMNIYLNEEEDLKLNSLKEKLKISSKEEVIKKIISEYEMGDLND